MPKSIEFGDGRSGVSVGYTKSTQSVSVGGWYDGCCGIEGGVVGLGDFLRELGIDEKAVRKALKNVREVE
jgi:hypothetical protein